MTQIEQCHHVQLWFPNTLVQRAEFRVFIHRINEMYDKAAKTCLGFKNIFSGHNTTSIHLRSFHLFYFNLIPPSFPLTFFYLSFSLISLSSLSLSLLSLSHLSLSLLNYTAFISGILVHHGHKLQLERKNTLRFFLFFVIIKKCFFHLMNKIVNCKKISIQLIYWFATCYCASRTLHRRWISICLDFSDTFPVMVLFQVSIDIEAYNMVYRCLWETQPAEKKN